MKRADLDKRPADVSAMFDEVSRGYDMTNTLMSLGTDRIWRYQTRRAVDPRAGQRILDLACGSGVSTVSLASTGARVTGVDFSPGMLEVARERHGDHPRVDFEQGDATDLPFHADTFDAATIQYGLRNVADPEKAISELFRVVKPGGRVVIAEFSQVENPLWRGMYRTWMRVASPVIAKLSGSNAVAYDYLDESIESWVDRATLSKWMRRAGFVDVEVRVLTGGIVALHRGFVPTQKR